jgi:hypothetical protein
MQSVAAGSEQYRSSMQCLRSATASAVVGWRQLPARTSPATRRALAGKGSGDASPEIEVGEFFRRDVRDVHDWIIFFFFTGITSWWHRIDLYFIRLPCAVVAPIDSSSSAAAHHIAIARSRQFPPLATPLPCAAGPPCISASRLGPGADQPGFRPPPFPRSRERARSSSASARALPRKSSPSRVQLRRSPAPHLASLGLVARGGTTLETSAGGRCVSSGENGDVIRMGEKQEGIEIKRKGARHGACLFA